ncbi:MAG: bile acid:sodium symporter family protein [Oceanospirillaceae bacterium]
MISQVVLPICLALMMFSMGLSLAISDFKQVLIFPKAVIIGVSLQLIALPLIAWGIIISTGEFTSLQYSSAVGLIIIAACPSGATSNIIAHLSGGNAALSVTLTAIISIITPFILPISLSWQLGLLSSSETMIELPVFKTWMQLIIVTLLPIAIGMLLHKHNHTWTIKYQSVVSNISALLLFSLIALLVFQQWTQLQQQAWQVFYICILLCVLALVACNFVTWLFKFDTKTQQTLAIEVSIQNAGTGIFIALAILHQPELAILPLSYGLLMNIPALMFITQGFYQRQQTT